MPSCAGLTKDELLFVFKLTMWTYKGQCGTRFQSFLPDIQRSEIILILQSYYFQKPSILSPNREKRFFEKHRVFSAKPNQLCIV